MTTTVFLASAEDFEAMNRLFAEFFPTAPPVRSPVIVGLPEPPALFRALAGDRLDRVEGWQAPR